MERRWVRMASHWPGREGTLSLSQWQPCNIFFPTRLGRVSEPPQATGPELRLNMSGFRVCAAIKSAGYRRVLEQLWHQQHHHKPCSSLRAILPSIILYILCPLISFHSVRTIVSLCWGSTFLEPWFNHYIHLLFSPILGNPNMWNGCNCFCFCFPKDYLYFILSFSNQYVNA